MFVKPYNNVTISIGFVKYREKKAGDS